MNKRIDLSLNWTELVSFVEKNKERLYRAKNGKDYLGLTMWANDTPDYLGNDYSVKPRAGKQDFEAKTRLPFVGNAKIAETKVAQNRDEAASYGRQQQDARRPAPAPQHDINEEDFPF